MCPALPCLAELWPEAANQLWERFLQAVLDGTIATEGGPVLKEGARSLNGATKCVQLFTPGAAHERHCGSPGAYGRQPSALKAAAERKAAAEPHFQPSGAGLSQDHCAMCGQCAASGYKPGPSGSFYWFRVGADWRFFAPCANNTTIMELAGDKLRAGERLHELRSKDCAHCCMKPAGQQPSAGGARKREGTKGTSYANKSVQNQHKRAKQLHDQLRAQGL